MKNRLLKRMALVLAFVFVLGLTMTRPVSVMAASEISEEAQSLKDTLEGMLSQFNTTAEVDDYLSQMVTQYESYYGEGAGDELKEMYAFLYDWVDVKKEVGDMVEVSGFDYSEDESGEITDATLEIKCADGNAVLTYAVTDGKLNVTVEKKATFGDLMKNAGLNTLLGMGTVFLVLIFICLVISCFKFIGGGNKPAAPAPVAAPAAPAPVLPEAEEDVTDDLELVAVISAAIAAAEGTSTEGFQVRSIKRVRRSNW